MPAKPLPPRPCEIDLYWGVVDLGVTFFRYSHGSLIEFGPGGNRTTSYFGGVYDPVGQRRRLSDSELEAWMRVVDSIGARETGGEVEGLPTKE